MLCPEKKAESQPALIGLPISGKEHCGGNLSPLLDICTKIITLRLIEINRKMYIRYIF